MLIVGGIKKTLESSCALSILFFTIAVFICMAKAERNKRPSSSYVTIYSAFASWQSYEVIPRKSIRLRGSSGEKLELAVLLRVLSRALR